MPAQPEAYSIAVGERLFAGRHYAPAFAALMGDSLTADSYGLSNFYIANGANGGKLKLLANCGVSGQTVEQMRDRIDNLYTNSSSPGFAGLAALAGVPKIGFGFHRGGANNYRSGGAFPYAAMTTLLEKSATHCVRTIILSCTPVTNSAGNAISIEANAWLAAYAAADPTRYKFIDDSAGMRNPDGSVKSGMLVDDVHYTSLAKSILGAAAAAAMESELAPYASPLSTDPADIYPAADQWFRNPTMAGTGGSKGGAITGTVANNITVSGNATAVASIVAADVGDPNQTPWQRFAISAATAGANAIQMYLSTLGRTMTSADPSWLDVLAEIRLTNIDTTKLTSAKSYIQANTGEFLSPEIAVDFERVAALTKTYVLRNNRRRDGATTPTSISFYLNFPCGTTFTEGAGTIDIRCITARG